jgi:hypothetical protein
MWTILLHLLLSIKLVCSFYNQQVSSRQSNFLKLAISATNGGQRAYDLIKDIIPNLYSVESNGVFRFYEVHLVRHDITAA